MIEIRNNIIPVRGFSCLTIYCFLFIRRDREISEVTKNHERIHMIQQCEILVLSLFLFLLIDLLIFEKILLSPFSLICYFVFYVLNWVYNLGRGSDNAYRDIIFEKEAYENQENLSYCKKRFFRFSFLKKRR